MTLLLALGIVCCGLAILLALETVYRPQARRQSSLRRVVDYVELDQAPKTARREERQELLAVLVPALSAIALKLTPRVRPEELQVKLAAAGLGSKLSAQQFLALKTVLALAGFVLGFGLAGIGSRGLLLALVLSGLALVGPDFLLARRGRSRAERLSAHLPEAIDQIVVSLEAGLGFDAAVSYFVQRSKSPLAAELRVMLSHVRMGESRSDALKRLAERVPSDEMRGFVHTLVQSEGAGISRAAILSSQAADLRHRRQLAAEERAQKAPVKMLFPVVIFILPVTFVVILGPAFQQAERLFGS